MSIACDPQKNLVYKMYVRYLKIYFTITTGHVKRKLYLYRKL